SSWPGSRSRPIPGHARLSSSRVTRPVLLVSAALVAAGAFVYAPARHHEFVNFDDIQYVSQNPAVTGGLNGRSISWALTTGHAGNWHPLTWLSHMLDVELFGLDPGA